MKFFRRFFCCQRIESIPSAYVAWRAVYVKYGCRSGQPGWESIPGLLKRFTNSGSGEIVIFQHCNSIPGHFTYEYLRNSRRSKEPDVKTWIKTVKSIDLAFEMQLLYFIYTYSVQRTRSITVETFVAENFGCNRVKKGRISTVYIW